MLLADLSCSRFPGLQALLLYHFLEISHVVCYAAIGIINDCDVVVAAAAAATATAVGLCYVSGRLITHPIGQQVECFLYF